MSTTHNLAPKRTKTQSVMDWINERIDHHVYTSGQRLPSVRQLAKQLQVSTFTVTQAYEQLVAAGRVTAKAGSGFYVTPPLTSHDRPKINPTSNTDTVIDTQWLMQQLYSDMPPAQSPSSGSLPAAWLQYERMPTIVRQVALTLNGFVHRSEDIRGYEPLRQQFCHQTHQLGMKFSPENLITTNGVSSAITLLSQHLLNQGDTVIVDNPGWFWLASCLQTQGFRVVGVDRDHEGPDIEQLRQLFIHHKPKLYVTNSVLQNPTSYHIHPSRAYQVLNMMHEYDAYILEDDIYGSFDQTSPALRYATLDQTRVFYVGGVSKVLGSNWRLGLLHSPSDYQQAMLRQKTLSHMNGCALTERSIYRIWTDSSYRKHIDSIRQSLQDAHQHMQTLLPQFGFVYPEHTQLGFFIWLDTGVDSTALALAAKKANWLIAPGHLFYSQKSESTHIRINVGKTSKAFLSWLQHYITQQH